MQSLLPLLLILVCPLMMIFMMRGMHGGHGRSSGARAHDRADRHPDFRENGAHGDSTAELISLRIDLEMRIEELDARTEELDARIEQLERAEESKRALLRA